jgi:hypothetical protein
MRNSGLSSRLLFPPFKEESSTKAPTLLLPLAPKQGISRRLVNDPPGWGGSISTPVSLHRLMTMSPAMAHPAVP